MRSTIVFLTAIAAAPALAEQVNFTVTPPAGQRITQIRIEPICATCTSSAVPTPEPPRPAKSRKPRAAKKPARDCTALTAERDKCVADLAAVGKRITAAEEEIKKLKEQAAPASPPAADKPQTRRRRPARQQQTASPPAAVQGQTQGGARLPPFRILTAPATPGGNQ